MINKVTSISLGIACLGFSLFSTPASAVNFTKFSDADVPSLSGWTDLGWKLEGRAGVKGYGDWEIGIGENIDPLTPTEQLTWDWDNGETVNWELNWDGSTVNFTFDNRPELSYTSTVDNSLNFDSFYLWTRATTKTGKVAPHTEIYLEVTEFQELGAVDFTKVSNIFSFATAPESSDETDITKNWFTSDREIAALKGIVRMSWDENAVNPNQARARSLVGFKIVGYDNNPEPTSVPEPGIVLGLLSVSGVALMQKRRSL